MTSKPKFEPSSHVSVLQDLRCFFCNGWLSTSPVRALPNGSFICGRCPPRRSGEPLLRVYQYEALLQKISFPCRFQKFGCLAELIFDDVLEHENQCEHGVCRCPASQVYACQWKGASRLVLGHLVNKHPLLLKSAPNFNVDLSRNGKGIFLVHSDGVVYIFRYVYESSNKLFKYDFRYFPRPKVHFVTYRLQLKNFFNSSAIYLKARKSHPFDFKFYDTQDCETLSFKKISLYLQHPTVLKITVQFKLYENNPLNEDVACNNCVICGDCVNEEETCSCVLEIVTWDI